MIRQYVTPTRDLLKSYPELLLAQYVSSSFDAPELEGTGLLQYVCADLSERVFLHLGIFADSDTPEQWELLGIESKVLGAVFNSRYTTEAIEEEVYLAVYNFDAGTLGEELYKKELIHESDPRHLISRYLLLLNGDALQLIDIVTALEDYQCVSADARSMQAERGIHVPGPSLIVPIVSDANLTRVRIKH